MSNIHSKQTGTQVHKPRRFDEAQDNSVLTRVDSRVGYVSGNHLNANEITPVADVSGNLNNTYFSLWTRNNTQRVAVYFNVAASETFVLPEGYDRKIEVALSTNDTVATVIDEIVSSLTAADTSEHKLFTSMTDNTTTLDLENTANTELLDVSTSFSFSNTRTEIASDEFLCAESGTGELIFKSISAGAGDITQVSYRGDTGIKSFLSGNADFTIEGGAGLTTTIVHDTLTITLDEEKKSKSDIDSLVGVLGVNLGTFLGGTIADSRDIKTALQDLETKAEIEATSSVKGIAKYGADFTVTSGSVSLAAVSHTTKSFRWSANNLNGSAESTSEYTFAEPNNNAHNRFFTNVDTSAMSYQFGAKGCVEMAIAGMNHELIGATLVHSGESGVSYNIKIYKAKFSSSETNMPMILMGTFSITGTANTDTDVLAITLEDGSDRVMGEGWGAVVIMDGFAEQTDMDCRGTVTLRFKDTNV